MGCILFVNLEGRISGAEKGLLQLTRQLRDEYILKAACPCRHGRSGLCEELQSVGVEVFNLPDAPRHSYRSVKSVSYFIRTCFCTLVIVFKVRPEIIHANNFRSALVTMPAVLLTRKRLVVHARDLMGFKLLARLLGLLCYKIIAISGCIKEFIIKQGVNPDKIRVVYNGTQVPGKTSFLQSPNRVDKGTFVFAQIGQLVPWKNNIAFVKAATQAASTLSEARFYLIGEDIFGRNHKYQDELQQYIRHCSAVERFSIIGWQNNLKELWKQIDCLVHTAGKEPFGRIIIEAMAHRVPVIAVDSCGPGEIIEHDSTGILVPTGSPEEICRAMIRIKSDSKLASRLACAAYKKVLRFFTAEKAAEQVKEIYRELKLREKEMVGVKCVLY